MSFPTSTHTPAAGTVDARRLLRTAGWSGIAVFAAWLLQPLAVFILTGGDEMVSYASLEAYPWAGAYEMVTFCIIGGAIMLMAVSLRDLADREGPGGPLAGVGHVLGVVAGLSWVVQAGLAVALFTTASSDLPDLGVDDQVAALAAHGIVQMGLIVTGALAMSGWLVTLATDGRRRGVLGRGLAVVALVAGVGSVLPFLVPFSPPWGVILDVVAALVLGIALLRRSRRG